MSSKKRQYHFSSVVCSVNEYNAVITEDKFKTAQAVIKFFRVLCDGFVRNGENIHVFSKRPTTKNASGKTFIPAKDENDNGVEYHYCRLFNIPVVSIIYSYLAAFFWYLSPANCHKNDVVIVDPLNVAIGYGTLHSCRLRRIKTVMFLTDLPRYYCYNGTGKMSRQQKLSEKLSLLGDAYIFITRQMNDVINHSHKPFIVMEGFVDATLKDKKVELKYKYHPFVCMYTGGLDKAYGLDILLDGFIAANIPNSELHIYGAGKFSGEVAKAAELHSNIKYFGCRNNSEVVDAQMRATLLINPRYTDAEFTKYSFPGKNLEYAASGTPTLTTKLPGMPEEYCDHVFLLEDETAKGMAKMLRELSAIPRERLYEYGQATKEWMLDKKNCESQARIIIDFLNNI